MTSSAKNSWPVCTTALSTWTFMWMCTARPWYQPGTIVVKLDLPLASVIWVPRRNVVPRLTAATPEYTPSPSQCQMSTAASLTAEQLVASTTLMRNASAAPAFPSVMSLRTSLMSR